uniref:Cupin type-2 domain-containing protein n=1 Tax=Bionectria ochroleuca TaxID=29856 RepID=A0A8H7MYF6_BIOOC
MDEEAAIKALSMPDRPISFVPTRAGEIIRIGPVVCRIMEDGSNTDNRIGAAEFTVPPGMDGPPAHWHEMHDETFLITAGTIRFHAPEGKTVDAQAGDYVVVPTRAPHTFSNPGDVEARFFNTFTPAYYINYFKLMEKMFKSGMPMNKDTVQQAMSHFATLPADGEKMKAKPAEGAN